MNGQTGPGNPGAGQVAGQNSPESGIHHADGGHAGAEFRSPGSE